MHNCTWYHFHLNQNPTFIKKSAMNESIVSNTGNFYLPCFPPSFTWAINRFSVPLGSVHSQVSITSDFAIQGIIRKAERINMVFKYFIKLLPFV